MQKKKHHLTKKQANALFLSTLMTAAAVQFTACAETEYIADTTKMTITEAVASDTIASSITMPAVDFVPADTSSTEEIVFEAVAETTPVSTEAETTTAESTTVSTTVETTTTESTTVSTTVETTTETTTVQTTTQETTKETTTVETAPVIETVTEESYRHVPYGTSYLYSDDYEDGERIVFYAGKRGKIRVITTKIYENGKLVDTQTVEKTITLPEDRVIIIGTAPKITITTETVTEKTDVLPFATVYEYDDHRYDDDVTVLEEGSDGYTMREYLITYENGKEVSKVLCAEEAVAMIPRRILVGTKPSTTYEALAQTKDTVPFDTEYVYDDTLDEGTQIVRQEGADGYTVLSYRVTYYRGEEKSRELTDTKIHSPQTKIIVIGTKEIKKEETFGLPYIDAAHGGVDYNVTQHYGNNGHGGMDIAVWYGDPIVSIKSGKVIAAYDEGDFGKDNILWTYGTYVVIEHEDGVRSYYAHLSDRTVSVGDTVSKGEIIGYSGNTGRVNPMPSASNPLAGTHLHFEIRVWNGYGYSTTDPRDYLPGWWGG